MAATNIPEGNNSNNLNHRGYDIQFLHASYSCPRLKLYGYSSERAIIRAINRKLPKLPKPSVPHCDSCQMLSINGVNCHEIGCPNSKKTWVPGRGWVRFLECRECGCDVEEGECCDCINPTEDPELATWEVL